MRSNVRPRPSSDDDDSSVTGTRDWLPDADGDGYGDETATPEPWCDPPSGMVLDDTDCDDTDPLVNPGAAETGLGLLGDRACDGGGTGSISRSDVQFVGETDEDRAGYSVSSAGDVVPRGAADETIASARRSADFYEVVDILIRYMWKAKASDTTSTTGEMERKFQNLASILQGAFLRICNSRCKDSVTNTAVPHPNSLTRVH